YPHLFDRHADGLGGHLGEHRVRALPHVGARVVQYHFLDLRAAAQFDDGVGCLRRAEAEADVLEARPKADAAPLDAVLRLRRLLTPPVLAFLTPARTPRALLDHLRHGHTRRERRAHMRRDALA